MADGAAADGGAGLPELRGHLHLSSRDQELLNNHATELSGVTTHVRLCGGVDALKSSVQRHGAEMQSQAADAAATTARKWLIADCARRGARRHGPPLKTADELLEDIAEKLCPGKT